MPLDAFGRDIHYLRVSLTDRCNLRCVYCLPPDISFRPASALMRDDELRQIVRLFAELGFDKFRLTGGEPTARAYLVEQGFAQPEAVFLFGESYGGFMTLFALGKRPELWAGGMPIVGFRLISQVSGTPLRNP